MPQSAENIKDHISLFSEPEYKDLLAAKKANYECRPSDAKVDEQLE